MAQSEDTTPKEKSEQPPFLQFTANGIRVNFGGYHAEAGLGGLLRGTGMGGGLHASAGTPWGAHAGAGLGGGMNGDDGRLGGGLYARAGLGNGRPEAAAGLGGSLDGSGKSLNPISGGMYAGATPGGGPGTGVHFGGGFSRDEFDSYAGIPASFDGETGASFPRSATASTTGDTTGETMTTDRAATTAGETKSTRGRTNIQIIPKGKKQEKERAALDVAALPAVAPADGKAESRLNEVRRAVKYLVVSPTAKVGESPAQAEAAPAVESLPTKSVVVAAAVPAHGEARPKSTDDDRTIATIDENPSKLAPRPVYPRWYFRKRFWSAPRKVIQISPTATDSRGTPSEVVDGLYADAVGNNGGEVVVKTAGKTYVSGSLFDDIFNIPISALAAVNQLLKNNVG